MFDHQGGPRGGNKTYLAGMVMAAARRDFCDGGTLNLRAMVSPEPLMGRRGYPLLLAMGETADGKTLLVDRQHPHDPDLVFRREMPPRRAPDILHHPLAGGRLRG